MSAYVLVPNQDEILEFPHHTVAEVTESLQAVMTMALPLVYAIPGLSFVQNLAAVPSFKVVDELLASDRRAIEEGSRPRLLIEDLPLEPGEVLEGEE